MIFGSGLYYLIRLVQRGFPQHEADEPKLGERPARPLSAATDIEVVR